jgi:hypothetical protein
MPGYRNAVIAEAVTWIRTPFHHEARVKGAGVDCGNFLIGVYGAVGLPVPAKIDHYPRDFMLHRDREWFLEIVLQFADEITRDEVLPGDAVIFKHGRSYSHGAIVTAWPRIIHAAYPKGVTYGDANLDPRPRRFFRHKEIAA